MYNLYIKYVTEYEMNTRQTHVSSVQRRLEQLDLCNRSRNLF